MSVIGKYPFEMVSNLTTQQTHQTLNQQYRPLPTSFHEVSKTS